jgi:hypothetical protein
MCYKFDVTSRSDASNDLCDLGIPTYLIYSLPNTCTPVGGMSV